MSLQVNQLTGFGVGGGVPLSLSHITYAEPSSVGGGKTAWDFGTLSIGTASADRTVIVVGGGRINSGTGGSLSSLTIGGNAATIHANYGADVEIAFIASLLVPSGTTANITANFSVNYYHALISVYALTGGYNASPTVAGDSTATSATSHNVTLTKPGGGVAVYVFTAYNVSNISWSSATLNRNSTVAENKISAASITTDPALTSHIETASWTTSKESAIAAAAWASA